MPTPAFPPNLIEAPIQRIPLSDIQQRKPEAESALLSACKTHGFFYLDLTTCSQGRRFFHASNNLLKLSKDAFSLPLDEKEAVSVATQRSLFGYRGAGIVAAHDPYKRKNTGGTYNLYPEAGGSLVVCLTPIPEFWNIAKDDMLDQSAHSVPYPEVIQNDKNNLTYFMKTAHELGMLVVSILAEKLGISPSDVLDRHKVTSASGDHVRLTYSPGDPQSAIQKPEPETTISTFAHTDFGSVTLLFNWLGGLQIETQEEPRQWQWVRPLPGHAICNLGDAMVEFTGGKVRSGRHRVVSPPADQAKEDRYSVVYFVRPNDDVELQDLTAQDKFRAPGEKRWKAKDWIEEKARQMGNTVKKE